MEAVCYPRVPIQGGSMHRIVSPILALCLLGCCLLGDPVWAASDAETNLTTLYGMLALPSRIAPAALSFSTLVAS